MTRQNQHSGGKSLVAGVTAVAAVYVYFLIFAQFGFLRAAQAALGGDAGTIRSVMIIMGLAGIAGSILAAGLFTGDRARRQLAGGLGLCAVAAALTTVTGGPAAFQGVAALVGLGTGLATVTLAGMLRRAVGGERLGVVIGLGTGLAYAVCNLPAVFNAGTATQAQVALLAAFIGLAAGSRLVPRASEQPPGGPDHSVGGITAWICAFLVLVCLDSAAFYIIQHSPALKEATWSGGGRLLLNAGAHFVAAVLAGVALDRRRLGATVLFAAVALLLACALLGGTHVIATTLLYVSAVSAYSTALVYYPANSQRPWVGAWVYAVAGWAGSGLGIGLAAGRPALSPVAIVVAGLVMGAVLVARALRLRRGPAA